MTSTRLSGESTGEPPNQRLQPSTARDHEPSRLSGRSLGRTSIGRYMRTSSGPVTVIVRRAFEIALGLILFLASVVPIGGLLGFVLTLFEATKPDDLPLWARFAIMLLCVGLAWFCVVTGSRLLTGRERPGGGLLHPWLVVIGGYIFGFLFTWRAFGMGAFFGPEYAQASSKAADQILAQAREARLRLRKSRPPNKPLQPTSGV